ncbi:MAG: hypothetical protein ACE5OZ_23330 [Candidatus Heimdallarchaeota archaeon]
MISKAQTIGCHYCRKEIEPDFHLENVVEVDYEHDESCWIFYHRRCHPRFTKDYVRKYEEFPEDIKEKVDLEAQYFIRILKNLAELAEKSLSNLMEKYPVRLWRDTYECQEIAINQILHDLDPDAQLIPTHESGPLEAIIMEWIRATHVSPGD